MTRLAWQRQNACHEICVGGARCLPPFAWQRRQPLRDATFQVSRSAGTEVAQRAAPFLNFFLRLLQFIGSVPRVGERRTERRRASDGVGECVGRSVGVRRTPIHFVYQSTILDCVARAEYLCASSSIEVDALASCGRRTQAHRYSALRLLPSTYLNRNF